MNHLQFKRMRVGRTGGVLLALLLIAGFISAVAPIASVFAGNTCALACCAGRAPHAAGSCMDGTCHAAVRVRNKTSRFSSEPTTIEKLCGVKSLKVTNLARTIVPRQAQPGKSQPSWLEASMWIRPCEPDCRAATFSTANQRRPREKAGLSFADRGRRPSALRSLATQNIFVYQCDALRWQANPRAPPVLSA
jgi:hypothetical protein